MTWTPPTGVIPTDRKSPSVPALADIPAMLDWLRDYYPGNTVIGVLATARAERMTYRVDGEPGYGVTGTLANYTLTKLDWGRDLVDAALADIPDQVAAGLAPVDAALDQVADSIAATAQAQAANDAAQDDNNARASTGIAAVNAASGALGFMNRFSGRIITDAQIIDAEERPLAANPHGIVKAWGDENGKVAWALKSNGRLHAYLGLDAASLTLTGPMETATTYEVALPANGLNLIEVWRADVTGKPAMGLRADGSIYIGKLVLGTSSAATSGLNLNSVVLSGATYYAAMSGNYAQVYRRDTAGRVRQLTSGNWNHHNLTYSAAGVTLISNREGPDAPYLLHPDGGLMRLPTTARADDAHMLIGGQSLSVGTLSTPVLSTTQRYNNVMLDDGVRSQGANATAYAPLVEVTETDTYFDGAQTGETAASGWTNQMTLARLLSGAAGTQRFVASAHGKGATALSGLNKGTAPYANGLAQVTKGRQISTAAGRSYVVGGILWVHGESDESANNANYAAGLKQLIDDYDADIRAITGQTGRVPFLFNQMSSHTRRGGHTVPVIAPQQLQVAEEYADRGARLIGPLYPLPHIAADGVHLTAESERRLGEYAGKARHWEVTGRVWKPLMPRSVQILGSSVYVQFIVPVGPLVLDTTLVTDPGNYGFELLSDTNARTITGVTLAGPDTVRIDLSGAPSAGASIAYAWTGIANNNAGPTTGARGCLRDSDTTLPESGYGGPLYNWCVHFRKTLGWTLGG